MPWLSVVLALGAAMLFALGAVGQQQAAATNVDAGGGRLILRLITNPRWLAASFGNLLGYGLQALALAAGSLLIVQPLLIAALVFALPLGARWNGRAITRSEIGWALAISLALATFLLAGHPEGGRAVAPLSDWWSSIAVCGGIVVVLSAVSVTAGPRLRSLGFAIVAGTCVGFASALTKSVVNYVGHGLQPMLSHWETYALVGVAVVGVVSQQLAFQSGSLEISFPATMILDPVVAVFVAIDVFDEHVDATGVEWVLIAACALVLVCGTIALARAGAPTESPPAKPLGTTPALES
jgi:drug/metabolite transporter (DMT)-like permease